jgi:hypothetical protein
MTRTNTLSSTLFGLLLLETAFLLGGRIPSASADEHEEPIEEEQAVEAPAKPALVCRYFELDGASMKGDAHGEINTANPTGEIEKFLTGDHARLIPHSMDFELGRSISGKPTYWVQICLSKA